MPYLESNQDASQNELFNNALLMGAVFVGAAAAGQMAYKSIAEKWGQGAIKDGKQVAKALYGKEAGNLQKGITDEIRMPNYVEDGPQYNLVTPGNKNRAPRLKRTDGSMMDRLKSNWLSPTWSVGDGWASKFMKPADKNLALFNRRLKDLHSGKTDYSGSKLNMYEDIVDAAENGNINLTARQAVDASNHAYASDANYYKRRNAEINSLEDDVALTNNIWGDLHKPDTPQPRKPSRHVPLAKNARGNMANGKAITDAKMRERYLKNNGYENEQELSDWWNAALDQQGTGDDKLTKDLKWLQGEAKASDNFLEQVNKGGSPEQVQGYIDTLNKSTRGEKLGSDEMQSVFDYVSKMNPDEIPQNLQEAMQGTVAANNKRVSRTRAKEMNFTNEADQTVFNNAQFKEKNGGIGYWENRANAKKSEESFRNAYNSAQNRTTVSNYESAQQADAQDLMRTKALNKKAMREQRQIDFAEQQRINKQAARDRAREKERIEAEQKQANANAKKGRTAMWQTMNSDRRSVVGETYGVDSSKINYNGLI